MWYPLKEVQKSINWVEARHKTAWYLGAKTFQLRCCHANQLHSLFIVGDGACQIGNLDRKHTHIYFLATDRDSDTVSLRETKKEQYIDA